MFKRLKSVLSLPNNDTLKESFNKRAISMCKSISESIYFNKRALIEVNKFVTPF